MEPFVRLIGLLIVLMLAVAACGEDGEGESQGASSDRSSWNATIEPPIVVDGLAVPVAADLPVVAEPGPVTGEGIIGVSLSGAVIDGDHLYLELGRSAGCATVDVTALVPREASGTYELFHDTDNLCEAFMISGFRTPVSELGPAADGTITIVDSSGARTSLDLD